MALITSSRVGFRWPRTIPRSRPETKPLSRERSRPGFWLLAVVLIFCHPCHNDVDDELSLVGGNRVEQGNPSGVHSPIQPQLEPKKKPQDP